MQQRLPSGFRAAYQSITAPSRRAWLGSAATLVLLVAVWSLISSWYRDVLIADKRSEIAASLAHDGNALAAAIDHRAVALQSLTAYILFHQTEANLPQETEADMILETQFASNWLQENLTGIDYVAVAPDGRQRYVFPLTGNEDQLDVDLMKQPAPGRNWQPRPSRLCPGASHRLLRGVQRR
jgi:sensor domain CHASE-containing protein